MAFVSVNNNESIESALRRILRNIDSELLKGLHGQRIDCTWLQARAVRFEEFAARLIQQCRRHLAAGTVMSADK